MFFLEKLDLQINCFFGRDKVLCGLRAWDTAHGSSLESHLRIVYRLCLEESLLWDGDADKVWAFWYQPFADSTEGACCLVGPMICTGTWIWFDLFWSVTSACTFSKQSYLLICRRYFIFDICHTLTLVFENH